MTAEIGIAPCDVAMKLDAGASAKDAFGISAASAGVLIIVIETGLTASADAGA